MIIAVLRVVAVLSLFALAGETVAACDVSPARLEFGDPPTQRADG